jgi:uncharacterized membrane protein
VEFENREREVREFFSTNSSDVEKIKILDSLGVSYVFWGLEERSLGDWDPNSASFLTRVYSEGPYSFFEVTLP